MRNLTLGAIVLATLIGSGAAFAADEPSRNAADAAAEAAAGAVGTWRHQPLGYAVVSERAGAFADLREQAPLAISRTDSTFLAQGDRGIGNE